MMWWATLVAATVSLCWAAGKSGVKVAALAVGLNWLYCTLFVLATHQYTPYAFFTLLDTVAFFVVTSIHGRMPKVLGATYALQVVIHWAFALSHGDVNAYLGWLDTILYLQLAILAAWGIHDAGGWARLYRVVDRLRHPSAAHAEQAPTAARRDGE